MLSAAAIEELQRYEAQGRIGGALELAAEPERPEPGEAVWMRWNFAGMGADRGRLLLPGVGEMIVPPQGRQQLRIGAAPLAVRLETEAGDAELVIEPRLAIPRILELGVMERAVRGEPAVIRWRAEEAEGCRLRVRDGLGREVVFEGGGEEVMEYRPQTEGELLLRLEARSRHAEWSAAARVAAEVRVEVAPPPVRIHLPQTRVAGLPGQEVRVGWRVTEAARVLLHAVDRGQALQVPAVGAVFVEVGAFEERFRLVATGRDGAHCKVEFVVVPRAFDPVPDAELLRLLEVPWE